MPNETEVLRLHAGLSKQTLTIWVERGWISPKRRGHRYQFTEIDMARVSLIHEFAHDLALSEDAIDVILPLIDQVHGLRSELSRLAQAIETQPSSVRQRIIDALKRVET